MTRAFVSVGSNVHPLENVPRGLERLAREVRIMGVSRFYRTPPVGPDGQPPFVNGMVRVETDLPPDELKWRVLRGVEAALGRVRTTDKYAPRPLDLDLVLYGDLVSDDPDLPLPDPELAKRPFLATPLHELAPDLTVPALKTPIRTLALELGTGGLEPLPDLTATVRETLGL